VPLCWHRDRLPRGRQPLAEAPRGELHGKARDELFARVLYDDWCDAYNRIRPHSSLVYLAPAVFAAALINPEPSPRVDH
jgi:transposase InsO family protein